MKGLFGKVFGGRRGAGGEAPRAFPLSPTDRKFVKELLEGVTAQVAHEQRLIATRGREAVVVRLSPQVPAAAGPRRSWLGGGPALPPGVAWPTVDGAAAVFLAQIACADLPADLWDGLGPRRGSLAVFIHPEMARVKVLHLDGPLEARPAGPTGGWRRLGYQPERGESSPAPDVFPAWPVDLVPVRPGDPDPYVPSPAAPWHAAFDAGYDLHDPAHRPFDWPSALAMVDMAARRLEARLADWAPLPEQLAAGLEKTHARLAEEEAAGAPDSYLAELRLRLAEGPELIESRRAVARSLIEVVPKIEALRRAAHRRAGEAPFTPQTAEELTRALRSISLLHAQSSPDPAPGGGPRSFELVPVPLTVHHPDTAVWAHEFETLREEMAMRAYLNDPATLPPAIRTYLEPYWRSAAAREMASIGHTPLRFVHEFDPETEVVLLELPTSHLLGWMWGDVDNLVLTIGKAALAKGDFSGVSAQVSN